MCEQAEESTELAGQQSHPNHDLSTVRHQFEFASTAVCTETTFDIKSAVISSGMISATGIGEGGSGSILKR